MSFRELLTAELMGICELSGTQLDLLQGHYDRLVHWNQRLNLTSVKSEELMVRRHYCESVFVGTHLPAESVSIVDVGSGAGFPGFPIAVLRPDCQVTLVESHQRKSVFLRECSRELKNVRVASVRAESLPGPFDWMVCRAVNWEDLPRLGRSVALLVGEEDANRAAFRGVTWKRRLPIPWADREFLLIGD